MSVPVGRLVDKVGSVRVAVGSCWRWRRALPSLACSPRALPASWP
jgi:hypothetical protein